MVPDSSIRNSDIKVFSPDVYGLSHTMQDIPSKRIVVVNSVIPFHYPKSKRLGSAYWNLEIG